MSERRFPIGLLVIAPVVAGFGVYAFTGQAQVPDPTASATSTAEAAASPTPESTFWSEWETISAGQKTARADGSTATPEPSPTPEPTATSGPAAQRGSLREGVWVRVNAGEGDCLNARNQPSLDSDWVIVNTCLPHGFEGYVTGEAQPADGHWWWFIAGAGWVAEEYLEYVGDVDIRARTLPELSGRGMIAFIRQTENYDNEIWVMNAGGTGQRLLRPADNAGYPRLLGWSPDGSSVVFGLTRAEGSVRLTSDVHIIPIADPAAEIVIENAFGAAWSPDGTRIATIADPQVDQMGGGAKGVPAIVDIATGERQALASEPFRQQSPPSFNHDGTKLVLTYANYDEGAADPGPRIVIVDLGGNELARIVPPADSYYGRPTWSPLEDRIEFHVGSSQGQPQYVVYDLTRRDIVAGARVPAASDKIGGGCGSWDMWTASWSRDGRTLLYSFDLGETGANGIWRWDIASGEQSLVPAIFTSSASPGPDGYAAFSSSGYDGSFIMIASPGGGFPALLTDGWNPVWSP